MDRILSQNDTLLKRGYAGSNVVSVAPADQVRELFLST